jgi:hypothetical protein
MRALLAFILVISMIGCGQRHVKVEVELPTATPSPNATYTASTTTWRLGTSRVKAPFVSEQEGLTCAVEGRLLTAEVRVPGDQLPSLPATWTCAEEHMKVDVILTAP